MVESAMAAKMPASAKNKRKAKAEDISEKDEFHLPQIPEEEIQKFTIEEDLSECDRIKLLLSKRDPNQFGYVFLNAVNIFRNDIEMQSEILPLLVVKIKDYSEDQQVMAGDALTELIQEKILDEQFAELIFDLAEEMLSQWSRQILEAWIGIFAKLLPVLARSQNGARQQHFIQKGVNLVKRMSQRTETLAVRTSSALLIGAIADENSLLNVATFETNFLPLVTNICQDFNWEVRKEICGQLPFIGKYLSPQKAYQHLYPELIELLDDEEREVVITAIEAFGELVELFTKTDDDTTENNITDIDSVKEQLLIQLKKMLSSQNFIGKVDISRVLLINVFWVATMINIPQDAELQQQLLELLKAWRPGPDNRYQAEDYEKQYIALALSNLAKLYQEQTIPLFYEPLYNEFVSQELSLDKSQEGSKIQFAQVYPSFIEHALRQPEEESKSSATTNNGSNNLIEAPSNLNENHRRIIDQYSSFFDKDQNKEVLHMALDHVADLIVKMQSGMQGSCVDQEASTYFSQTFKTHFRTLERSIVTNWRLHRAYYEAQGQLCLATKNTSEAVEIVAMMLKTIKGKTCSLPVKKLICEKLALMISTKQNYLARQKIHSMMLTVLAASRSSQQRQAFLYYLENLLPLISSAHFNQVYAEIFLEFREEPVNQVLIQWVKLFPAARLRINDQRMADRLELLLRNLHTKYSKIQRSSLVLATLEDVSEKMRSDRFLSECRDFIQNKNPVIQANEIQIDQMEQEEQKSAGGDRSNQRKNKGAGASSMSNLLSPPSSQTSGKRPGSQRYPGSSPSNRIQDKRVSKANAATSGVPAAGGGRNTGGAAQKSNFNNNISTASATRANANRSALTSSQNEERKGVAHTSSMTGLRSKVPKARKL